MKMPPINSVLDHLVIVAATLDEGVAYCEAALGVRMLKGGEHVRMGTHNYLLNLENETYLEVIAINPAASPPSHPRWFGMDNPRPREQSAKPSSLTTFVARTNNIAAAAVAMPALGPVYTMQRGTLQWQITIPEDGELIEHGTVPALLQWPEKTHPTHSMTHSGCRLIKLEVHHPRPQHLAELWSRIGLHADETITICAAREGSVPYLTAYIDTPSGVRRLR